MKDYTDYFLFAVCFNTNRYLWIVCICWHNY